jgi:hypothetical protein
MSEPIISTVAAEVEYYEDKIRTSTVAVQLEYDNFALSTVAVQVEYQDGEPLLAVGQYYRA